MHCRGLIVAVTVAALMGGCSQVMRPEQADQGEQVDSIRFLHQHLQEQPLVTVAEAYRAVLMLADGEDRLDSFAAREEDLLARKIIRPEWKLTRAAAIDRGSVAYMVCRVLQIRGGVNFRTLGALGIGDRRYAARELAYLDLMDRTPPYRYMSGAELVDLMAKADRYMMENGMYAEEPTRLRDVVEPGAAAMP